VDFPEMGQVEGFGRLGAGIIPEILGTCRCVMIH